MMATTLAPYRCEVDGQSGATWHELVATFEDALIDQTWSYAGECWGSNNLSHLVVHQGSDVVAACQVVLLRPPLLRKGIAHVKFGPLWQPRGREIDPERLQQVLACLRREYVEHRGLYLRVMPPAPMGGAQPLEGELTRLGFDREPLTDPERFVVDLSHPTELLRAGLKSKWRYHLKKSEQQDLRITHGPPTQYLTEFLALYGSMREVKDFADTRALKRLPQICAGLPDALQPAIWLCHLDNRPVAGAVVSRIGHTALYLFGASDEHGRRARAGYRLQWSIITWLRQRGCRWYDLGGGCENAGLRQFKSGLVGRHGLTPALSGHFDLSGSALSALIAKTVFALKNRLG